MYGRHLHPGVQLADGRYIKTITDADHEGFRRARLHPKRWANIDGDGAYLYEDEVTTQTFHVREGVATKDDERRRDLALGLRQLANQIERNMAIPVHSHTKLDQTFYNELQTKDEAAALVRSLKPVDKDYIGSTLHIGKEFGNGAVEIAWSIGREEVCKKIERTEIKTVIEQDPEELQRAKESVPAVEGQKPVKVVEWECEPLLAAN